MWSGGALAMVCVAGGLTMTVEKTVLLQDDVADIGFRAGTDIPAQQIIAAQAQSHEDSHLLQVLDVVGCSH